MLLKILNSACIRIGFYQMFKNIIGFDYKIDAQYSKSTFPPHNIIEVDANTWELELACAGYPKDAINIQQHGRELVVSGEGSKDDHIQFIVKGISTKSFIKRFAIADGINVASATYHQGILSIKLVREILKPKTITIDIT